jgi:DegV family protein with EDD domain
MKFTVMSDSVIDITLEESAKLDIPIVPLDVSVGGEIFQDRTQIDPYEFYRRMLAADDLPKTSQPSPATYLAAYRKEMERGAEHIVVFTISSGMSGSYESACIAARQVDCDVRVVDTKEASPSQFLPAYRACELRDAGYSLDDAMPYILEAVDASHLYIAVHKLDNFVKGGRLNPALAAGIGLLNIKPIFTPDERGIFTGFDKVRGVKGLAKRYARIVSDHTRDEGMQRVRFIHTDNEEGIQQIKDLLAAEGVEFHDLGTSIGGSTVGTHLGCGAFGLALMPEPDPLPAEGRENA